MPPNEEPRKRRERPAHWAHPVDEERREARAQRQRRRRTVLAAVLLGLVGLVAAYFYLTSDERVEEFAERYLENLFGTRVHLARASFSLTDGLVLEQLAVMPPKPFTEPLLVADRVELRINPLSLFRLAPEVTEIVVHRPHINLVLWNEERWNFQAMTRTRPMAAMGSQHRPVVALGEGLLCIQRKIAGETVYEQTVQISGLLLPSETNPDAFRFQTDVTSQTVHLSVASGLIDARTGALRFEGQASNVVLSPELYQTLPREAQRIWDRFEPTGSVNLKVLFDEKHGFGLVTELTGVHFAYQYEGLTYRFENLTGRCTFSSTALTLAGVQGLLNGSPVRLEGEISGFDGERLGLDLAVRADQVDFQANRAVLVSLAPHMETVYAAYSPKGQADVAMNVHRGTDPKAPMEVSGTIFCRDMEATYARLPYRLERLRGAVQFGPDGYVVDGVEGVHGQASFRLEGWVKRPGSQVEARIHVHGQNVPLDEDLRMALSPSQRRLYDQYHPAGAADIDLDVYRPPAENAPLQTTVRLDLLGCQIRYEGFPYLLTEATGRVIISPDRAQIVELQGRHGQAKIFLAGEVVSLGDSPLQLSLQIRGEDVPLDDDLDQAIPPRQRAVLQAFHLSGLADIEGKVSRGPETNNILDYDLMVSLKGARMIYEQFPFLAEQVTGQLHLSRDACRIESLTGFNSGARIEARGWIDQRPDDYAMDLELTGENVVLGESLRGALGPEMRTAWSHLSPEGVVDIIARLRKDLGPQEPLRHHVWVTAKEARCQLDLFPYPLEHLDGQMEFEGGEVRLHDLKARQGATEFVVGGRIAYRPEGPDLDLTIQARGLRLEGALREALPVPLENAFVLVRPTGRVDLNIERLTYRRNGPESAEARWFASAVLDEVGLEPGIKVSGIVGTAEMQGRWTNGRVAIQGDVWIQQGKVAGKNISDARLQIEKPEESSTVAIRRIEGEFYDGRLEGFATLNLQPGGKYAFNLAATGVNFERLLREGFRLEHNISGGRLRATIGLWAKGPDASTLEASGYADIDESQLYKLPPLVRVLNVLRLAPADQAAFQKARILYFIRGQRLFLGDIRLEGRAMNLYGAGTMESDGRLNLMFMTGKKNDDPLLPAMSELLEGLRKELVVVLVTGTLAEPQVEMRTLSGLSAPFRELVGLVRKQREGEARKRK